MMALLVSESLSGAGSAHLSIQCLRKETRRAGFPGPTRPDEKIRMGDLPGINSVTRSGRYGAAPIHQLLGRQRRAMT